MYFLIFGFFVILFFLKLMKSKRCTSTICYNNTHRGGPNIRLSFWFTGITGVGIIKSFKKHLNIFNPFNAVIIDLNWYI